MNERLSRVTSIAHDTFEATLRGALGDLADFGVLLLDALRTPLASMSITPGFARMRLSASELAGLRQAGDRSMSCKSFLRFSATDPGPAAGPGEDVLFEYHGFGRRGLILPAFAVVSLCGIRTVGGTTSVSLWDAGWILRFVIEGEAEVRTVQVTRQLKAKDVAMYAMIAMMQSGTMEVFTTVKLGGVELPAELDFGACDEIFTVTPATPRRFPSAFPQSKSERASSIFRFAHALQDYPSASKYLKIAADMGDDSARMAYAGYLLQGLPRDTKTAASYLMKVAPDAQDPVIMLGLAVILRDGIDVPRDAPEAARWFKRAADLGDASAAYDYALMLAQGAGVPKDERASIAFFQMAADQGHAMAQYQMGNFLIEGAVVPRDDVGAAYYWKLAADQGDAASQNSYGICLKDGSGVTRDPAQAVRYFEMSAAQGQASGHNNLGVMLRAGVGVARNVAKAAFHFKFAADNGMEPGAALNYAQCVSGGVGIPRDYAAAAKYFKIAADTGSNIGRLSFACYVQGGLGVPKNLAMAAKYFKLAADAGDEDGRLNYGLCLLKGIGVPKNDVTARRYLGQSFDLAAAGATDEAVRAACLMANSTGRCVGPAFLELWPSRCDPPESSAPVLSGRGAPREQLDALAWQAKADSGDAEGQFRFATCLLHGRGVEVDEHLAARYFKLSSDQGHPGGQNGYGVCLDFGFGLARPDPLWAQERYSAAAARGHAEASRNLAAAGKDSLRKTGPG